MTRVVSYLQTVGGRTFKSLRVRNYRVFFIGQTVSAGGTWMQAVAQEWLVLTLTNSALAVGVTAALQFLPTLLFGLYGGVLADRIDRRRLLIATRIAMGTIAVAFFVLTATAMINVWIVYALALALGMAAMIDIPARQAFLSELVPREHVSNAVSLNSAVMNTARIIGPAAAGILIATLGVSAAFAANALTFVAVIAALLALKPAELIARMPQARERGQIRAGLRYVWHTPRLRRTVLLLTVVATAAWNYRVVLPIIARFEFDAGAKSFGILYSIMAAGSLVGALVMANRKRPTPLFLVTATFAFGALMLTAAFMPTFLTTAIVLVPLGFASIAFMTTGNATLQLCASDEMRGRVMALFGIVFLGTIPVGGPLVGWLSGMFGPRAGFVLGGGVTLAAATVAAITEIRDRDRTATPATTPKPPRNTPEQLAAA